MVTATTSENSNTGMPGLTERTPMGAVLLVTALCSFGTGVIWNGAPFIAKHTYGFTQTRTLTLYAILGIIYMAGGFNAGRIIHFAQRWVSTRSVLVMTLLGQAAACTLPVLFTGEWTLWAAVAVVTALSAVIWPVLESYLTVGRHGPDMRRSIGWFNLVWAPFVALPLFVIAPLIEHHGTWGIAAFSMANLVALAALPWFPSRPGEHRAVEADSHIGPEYVPLMRSAQVLLPLSYVIGSAMNPILPYRFEQLQLDIALETPAAATWTVVRFAVFVLLWKYSFWHGRWGTLLVGAIAMTLGFVLVVTAPSLTIMLVGLGLIGAGLGMIYYAALYYAMSVGHAAVDASGRHEGLIGAGYAVGPIAGLVGLSLGGGAAIIVVVSVILAMGGVRAVGPYRSLGRSRTSGNSGGP